MKWTGFIFVIMLLVMSSAAFAETNESTDDTDYVGKSLDLRYENLICKIDFTIGQIDVINDYTNDTDADIINTLLNDKDMLIEDKDDLKTVYDDGNLTEFNDFLIETLHPDFNETSTDLREFKDDYKTYIADEDRVDFRNALIELKNEYTNCTSVRYTEMSKLMNNYYKHREGMWDQIIKSMNQRGLTTEEMEQAREQLQNRLQDLERAMNSSNQTQIRGQLQEMKDEHTQLWTKFHSGRLNSYLNRIEPAANKYGRSADVDKIKGQLEMLKNMSQNRTNRDEAKVMWNSLKDSADEMRDMAKDMAKQRAQDNNQGTGDNRQGSADNNGNGVGRR